MQILQDQVVLSTVFDPDRNAIRTGAIPSHAYPISAAGNYLVKNQPCVLSKLIINTAVSLGTISIYDGVDATGKLIAKITMPLTLLQSSYVLSYEVLLDVGLFVKTGLGNDVTVCWRE